MQNFIELLKDHALLIAAGKTLSAITREAEPRPAAAAEALRRLSRALERHLRDEAEFIIQDREHGRKEFTELAAVHAVRLEALVAHWQGYAARWDEPAIRAEWRDFGEETARILDLLAAQVDEENQSLYPAALRYGLIRLLPEKVQSSAT